MFINAEKTKIIAKDVKMFSLSLSHLFSPYLMEKMAPLPIDIPNNMDVRNVISVYEEPTAARASAPRKRPTISVSTTLYNC